MHDVPLVESRRTVQQDLHDKGGTYYDIANWRQRADRLALCQYLLTRELLQPDVGSIVMFAVPPGTGMQRPKEEHFLHTIDERVFWQNSPLRCATCLRWPSKGRPPRLLRTAVMR